MSKYTNPKVPEGISSGHDHPLADVARSSVIVLAFFSVLLIGIYATVRLAAPLIPFTWEQKLVRHAVHSETVSESPAARQRQHYIRALADRVAAASDLPPGVTVTVHYEEGDIRNAFATLGGQIYVYEGLWNLLGSENALAMLLAHEIAHVKNRDPIRSAGSTLLASIVAGFLIGDSGIILDLVGGSNLLAALHFSREQEAQADNDAAKAVILLYGHLNGANELFSRLRGAASDKSDPPAFLASHPNLEQRTADLRNRAMRNGWKLDGPTTPLPSGNF